MKLIVSIRFLAYKVYLFQGSQRMEWCSLPHDVIYLTGYLAMPLFWF